MTDLALVADVQLGKSFEVAPDLQLTKDTESVSIKTGLIASWHLYEVVANNPCLM
jgi:hypothetical protein